MQKRFYPCDKKMILKHSLSNTNTYVWSKKRVFLKYQKKLFLVL